MITNFLYYLLAGLISVLVNLVNFFAHFFRVDTLLEYMDNGINYFLPSIWYWQSFIDVTFTLNVLGLLIGYISFMAAFDFGSWAYSKVRGTDHN